MIAIPPPLLAGLLTATPPPPGHNGLAWTLVGTGAVLVLIGILFLVRKAVYAALSAVLIAVGAVLLLLAVLGEPLGIYPRIHRWWHGDDAPPSDAPPTAPGPGGTLPPPPG